MHQGRGGRCSPAQIGRLPWAADPVQALANSSTSRVASVLCWTLEVMKHLLCGLPVLSLLNVHRFWCNRRLGSTPARRKGCPPCARSSAPVLSPSTYRACIRTIDCRSPSLLMVCRHCCMHAATQHVQTKIFNIVVHKYSIYVAGITECDATSVRPCECPPDC